LFVRTILIINLINGLKGNEIWSKGFGKKYNFDSKHVPSKHIIQTVPYHAQVTDYSCGDGSLEMVLNYYGADVNQYSIMDVMRTSENNGTLSLDIVRGAHFSPMSSSVGIQWPQNELTSGYPGHPIGLAAFWYDSTESWLDFVKLIVANDIPVIVLMHFYTPPNVTDDGHFRVVVGYDDTTNQITMNDPWDFGGNPPIAVWSYEDFEESWNYIENDSPRVNPYFGVAVLPWSIQADVSMGANNVLTIIATVSYLCPPPFNCANYPASNVLVSLNFPAWMMVLTDNENQAMNLGNLYPGNSVIAKWTLECIADSCSGNTLSIVAKGIVSNSVPWTFCCNSTTNYSGYSYVDLIGGTLEIPI